jgi:hypothetical protein
MVKVATKPKKLVTQKDGDTLVSDHGIEHLTLHRSHDGGTTTYSGQLDVPKPFMFEASFSSADWPTDKITVREALLASAIYVDGGQAVAGHTAMNAKFKALIKFILADAP